LTGQEGEQAASCRAKGGGKQQRHEPPKDCAQNDDRENPATQEDHAPIFFWRQRLHDPEKYGGNGDPQHKFTKAELSQLHCGFSEPKFG
jgi:hypothetical protein